MDSGKDMGTKILEAQIAVIGGGGAGLAAAVAAAEMGADVIVLEKHNQVGGNSALASGLFGAESPTQNRMNIDAPADLFFRIHMNYSHWTVNPRLIHALINKSGDTIRWLEDKGLTFDIRETDTRRSGAERTFFNQPVPLTWHTAEGGGREIIDVLTRNLEEKGGRLLCNTGAKELSIIDDGRAIKILAEKKTGEEINIRARSVVIATGGYAGNKDLLRKYYPLYNDNIHLVGFPNMGDGLMMATKIGADTEGLGILHLGPKQVPGESHAIWVLSLQASTVWTNKKGERFADESIPFSHFELAHAAMQQPESISYTIFGREIRHNIIQTQVVRHGKISSGPPFTESELEEELKSAAAQGKNIKIANSMNDIARWMGADPEILRGTIDQYNRFCDNGYDEIFSKDPACLIPLREPPFYAIKCVPRFYGTIGGIKINHHMEVVDQEGNPIPGLFAAGIDTGGWEPQVYDGFLLGHALGFPINGGRIAGENAAKYISGK